VIKVVAAWSVEPAVDVLLIARDSSLAEMYRMKLEMDGYRVTTVSELRDWKAPAGGWTPDIVMIDLSVGDAQRLLDLRGLRSDDLLKDVPLLILSTQPQEELRRSVPLSPTDYVLRVPEAATVSHYVDRWTSQPLNSKLVPH
jgi:DNA-binding response OmpR family regulator